ncbi:MAG TPA: OstA-like protein [Taishania sp.]|nr:OstA-like protein [Taishania sp.]
MSAFFLCNSLFAQVFGELLPGSSALVYDQKKGIHKLLDGANFVYQGNTMYCDSAYYFENNKTIRAYGNVHIRKSDNINLFCDSLCYYSNSGVATLWGKVRAIDGEYRLTTDSLNYNTRKEQGIYRNGGKIENMLKKEVLTSKIGYFYPKSKNFFFKTNVNYESDELKMTTDSLKFQYEKSTCYFFGPTCIITEDAFMEANRGWYNMETEKGSLMRNASIEQDTRIIQGDSLIYNPREKLAEGFRHVFVQDFKDSIAFSGNYAKMDDSLKYSLLTDQAMLIKYQKDDTLYVHADTIFNQNDSLDQRLYTLGYHGVKIFSSKIQGIGDSLSYTKTDGYMELYKNPILWAKNGELKGDSMRVYMNDSIVSEARIWGKSTAVMEVEKDLYYNQVGGSEMVAYFVDNEVKIAKVIGNAQTIFYPIDESKEYVKADSMSVIKRAKELNMFTSILDSLSNQIAELDSLLPSVKDSITHATISASKDSLKLLSESYQLKIEQLHNLTDTLQEDSTKLYEIVTIKRMGMNRFYAAEIKIYFDSGEVVGVTYYDQPDGIFYPMDKINKEEQFIQHFKTNFALRPKSVEDLLSNEK